MKHSLSTKTKLNHQEEAETDSFKSFFRLYLLGNLFILLSGVLPFIHVFIPYKELDIKIFGYPSYQQFFYSAGTHFAFLLLTVGLLINLTSLTKQNLNSFQNSIKYTLLSPLISALFFLSWVFFPGVNYDVLAYVFLAGILTILSVIILFGLIKYVANIRERVELQEKVIKKSLDSIDKKLTNTNPDN